MKEEKWRYGVYAESSGRLGAYVEIEPYWNSEFIAYAGALFLASCRSDIHPRCSFETICELVKYIAENPIGEAGLHIMSVYLESGEERFREAIELSIDGGLCVSV